VRAQEAKVDVRNLDLGPFNDVEDHPAIFQLVALTERDARVDAAIFLVFTQDVEPGLLVDVRRHRRADMQAGELVQLDLAQVLGALVLNFFDEVGQLGDI
jgi:hypothetical protein